MALGYQGIWGQVEKCESILKKSILYINEPPIGMMGSQLFWKATFI